MPQDSYKTALGEKNSTVAIGCAIAPGSSLRRQQPPFFGEGGGASSSCFRVFWKGGTTQQSTPSTQTCCASYRRTNSARSNPKPAVAVDAAGQRPPLRALRIKPPASFITLAAAAVEGASSPSTGCRSAAACDSARAHLNNLPMRPHRSAPRPRRPRPRRRTILILDVQRALAAPPSRARRPNHRARGSRGP